MKENFLRLIRLGIGHGAGPLREPVDWDEVETLAARQGLMGVVLDGIQCLAESAENAETIPYKKKLEWLGLVMQGYELRYKDYRKALTELATFYGRHGYKMMVLKGYACGRDWPKPEHRPYGDIDIWLFGKQKEADAILTKDTGIVIDSSHHHHTVFNWMGFTVENHYDFVNVHALRSSAEMEKIFKELGKDDSHSIVIDGQRVYIPSPNLHALFLIKHLASHFVGANISLRQVLDWAFFVEKQTDEIDWVWLYDKLNDYGMNDFFNTINAICVEDLGFDATIFRGVQSNPKLKEKVLSDILSPAFTAETPKKLIPRAICMYRRWKGNGWKHELCYDKSRWDGFWTLLMSHLMKPKV